MENCQKCEIYHDEVGELRSEISSLKEEISRLELTIEDKDRALEEIIETAKNA